MAMIGRPQAVRLGVFLLAGAACVNLGAAVVLALGDPRRASDLWVMYDWCRAWLVDGASLYTGPDASADYPPNAIVLLSPIALVPQGWLVPIWTVGALALTPVLPWLVLRSASGRERAALAAPFLLYLCWVAPRTLLQFSLLSMTLAWVAVALVDTRGLTAGAALGLALFKPHIAGPIALWMLVTGRLRPLATAAGVVLAGWALYDVRIGESPLTTAAGLWRVIGSEYAGAAGLVGHTSLRAWAQLASADAAIADGIWIAVSAVLLAGVCALATRDRGRALDAGGLAVPALFCLWSLLVTYHNGNNLILMLPAFAFLWFSRHRPGMWHWIPIAILQGAMMFDVPVRLGGAAPGQGPGHLVIAHFDRVLLLAALAWVSALWYRLSEKRPSSRAARVRRWRR